MELASDRLDNESNNNAAKDFEAVAERVEREAASRQQHPKANNSNTTRSNNDEQLYDDPFVLTT